jgi:acetyltransferase
MAGRPYPAELEQEIRLDDGGRLTLRPIRPIDEGPLRSAFDRLSPLTVRMRFFLPMKRLTPAMAEHLTNIDYDREMAFVLTDPAPAGLAEIHGVVRLSADAAGKEAEFAIIVEDGMRHRGIGHLLMHQIIDYAASHGIHRIYGDILVENTAMLDLCRHLGFRPDPVARQGVLRVSLDLLRP